jgi:hypothetical protein
VFIANNQKFEASDCDLGPSRLAKPQQHEKPKAAVAVAAGGAVTARSTETQAAARAARRATRGVALASGNKRKTKDTDGDTAAAATHAPQVAGAKQTKKKKKKTKKKKKSKEVQPSYQTNLSVAQDGTTLAEAKLYELRGGEQGDDGTHLAVVTAVVKIMTAGELDEVTKMICNIIKPCCCGGGGCGGGSWSCSSVTETDRTKMTIDIPENGNCTPLRLAVV